MVAQPNPTADPIRWDDLDALAQKHLDAPLDDVISRIGIESRDDLERLTGTHTEALKYLGSGIALWRLKVKVFTAETRLTKNNSFYISLNYGFATIAVFRATVNSIFRNTTHLVVDWQRKGYIYEFNPFIIVSPTVDRNGYPTVSKIEEPKKMNEPENIQIHPQLQSHIDKRFSLMSMVDRAKYTRAYAQVLAYAYEKADAQDESSGWWRNPRPEGKVLGHFHHLEYMRIDELLEKRRVKSGIGTEDEYRITPSGCTVIGRPYPVQKDQLGQLLTLDDEDIDDDAEVAQSLAMETRLEREQAAGDADEAAADEAAAGDDLTLDPAAIEAAQASNEWTRQQFDEAKATSTDESPDQDEPAPDDTDLDDLITQAKHINGQGPQIPRIEVKTLVQRLADTTAAADKALADHLNDCWEIINISITTAVDDTFAYHTRIVTLKRTTKPAPSYMRESVSVPRQRMVTPVGEPVIIQAPISTPSSLNQLVGTLPIASTLRAHGAAAVRDHMNIEAVEAGKQAFNDAIQSYPRRQPSLIPARFGTPS